MKMTAKAKYGQVGSSYVPFEVAKMSFEKMGYEVKDLGNGMLEYEMEIDDDSPYLDQLHVGNGVGFSVEGAKP